MKTFCGILLCCLDASAITKKNGIKFNDFSQIVKYDHFSTLLLLLLLAQVTYNQVKKLESITWQVNFHNLNHNDTTKAH